MLCSCSSHWYQNYGITNKNALSQASTAPKLIKALEDPSANVRRTALKYISLHESSIVEAENKRQEMAKTDTHPNVRRHAENLLALLGKEIFSATLYDCNCSGFKAKIDNVETPFATQLRTKYIPENFRPIDGDVIKSRFYSFDNKRIVLSVTAVKMVEPRTISDKIVAGSIGEFTQRDRFLGVLDSTNKYPFILDDGREIIISLGRYPEMVFPEDFGRDHFKKGDKIKIHIKEQKTGKGSCYIYSVNKVEIL